MKIELQAKVERFQSEYRQSTGQPFNYFYCPILYKDENVPLCKGHIINKAFQNADKSWTVQRADVDNFYGSCFEADFTILQDIHNQANGDIFAKVFADRKLYKKIEPKILLDEKQIGHFFWNQTDRNIPQFTPLILEQEGETTHLGLKMNPDEVANSSEKNWEIEIFRDLRLAAVVSLIKAAHLTLFEIFGYRYAFSTAGEFVGRQILGTFFCKNHNLPKMEVLQNAHQFFREFENMVRPVQSPGFEFQGTITDKTVLICWDSGKSAWAMIVLVKTGMLLHAVMIPVSTNIDMIARYIKFLRNQNESTTVSLCQFNGDHWIDTQDRIPVTWTKTSILST